MHKYKFLQIYMSEVQEHIINLKCYLLSMSFDGPYAIVLLTDSPDEQQYQHMNENFGLERVD